MPEIMFVADLCKEQLFSSQRFTNFTKSIKQLFSCCKEIKLNFIGFVNIGVCLVTQHRRSRRYSAIAIDAPSSLTDSPSIGWGSVSLQGPRKEKEDDIVLRPDSLHGFSFTFVFDGHGGFASVQFLRDELYQECFEALQGGLLLLRKDFKVVEEAIKQAFAKAPTSLLKWLEMKRDGGENLLSTWTKK